MGLSEVCLPQGGLIEVRPPQVSIPEEHTPQVGRNQDRSLQIGFGEIGFAQVRITQIKPLPRRIVVSLPPPEDSEHGLDISCRARLIVCLLLIFRRRFPRSVLAHIGREDFHNRPMVLARVPRYAFQGVNRP